MVAEEVGTKGNKDVEAAEENNRRVWKKKKKRKTFSVLFQTEKWWQRQATLHNGRTVYSAILIDASRDARCCRKLMQLTVDTAATRSCIIAFGQLHRRLGHPLLRP